MKYLTFIRHSESYRESPPPPALMEAMGKFVQKSLENGTLVETGGVLTSKAGARVGRALRRRLARLRASPGGAPGMDRVPRWELQRSWWRLFSERRKRPAVTVTFAQELALIRAPSLRGGAATIGAASSTISTLPSRGEPMKERFKLMPGGQLLVPPIAVTAR